MEAHVKESSIHHFVYYVFVCTCACMLSLSLTVRLGEWISAKWLVAVGYIFEALNTFNTYIKMYILYHVSRIGFNVWNVFTVRFAQYRAPQLTLKPLFFEVPLQEPDPLFLGRHWLIREMEESLGSASPGVLITGNPGTGKSALILQLVDYSCFGRRRDPTYQQGKCSL